MSEPASFVSHLVELRSRLLRAVAGLVLTFLLVFPFSGQLYTLLAQPLLASLPSGGQMIATGVTTPFFVPLKLALMAAFIISLPHTLYQIWAFVAPGLYAHERRLVLPLVLASSLLFLLGMAFAYFLVFPVVLGFMAGYAPSGVAVMTDIASYLDFVMTLFLAFGLAFEVPIVVIACVRLGLVSIATLKAARPYVVVAAFILGAIFTPPDVISQFMLALPLWLRYELGLVVAGLLPDRKHSGDE